MLFRSIAVASTKAYSVQLAALYMIAGRMALVRGKYSEEETRSFFAEFLDVIPAMESMIKRKEEMKAVVT